MRVGISVLITLLCAIVLSCSSTKNNGVNPSQETIQSVSVEDLTKIKFVRQYEARKVRFTAKFGQFASGFDLPGIEQYRITHFLLSLYSEDKKAKLPYTLVPTYNKVLPGLKSGDLIQVQAKAHIASTGDTDDYIYIVVSDITKL